MIRIKNALRGKLRELGYEIKRPSSSPEVRFRNFQALVHAYEHSLGGRVAPNALRTKLLGRLLGTSPTQAYFIIEALHATRHVAGDVCEFGVAQGETSALIANEIADTQKRLHLFDSFEGLPAPTAKDELKDDIFALGSIEAYKGTMSCPEDMVIQRLRAIAFPETRYALHKGFIEKLITTDRELPTLVSFAYVDFDFYEPILVALRYLHGVMGRGSMIVIDDYDFFSTGAKTAVDEFVRSHEGAYACSIPDKRLAHCAVLTRTA